MRMVSTKTLKDFMSPEVVVVHSDTKVLDVAHIMAEHNFTGLPVVRDDNTLVGIVTEYDLLTKGSAIHLPTFLSLIEHFDIYKKDHSLVPPDVEKIVAMRVEEIMNSDPLTLASTVSLEDAARAFAEHHKVNPIPIVDETKKVIGILSRSDIIKFFTGVRPGHAEHAKGAPDPIEHTVESYLHDFERDFIAVSRVRTRTWLWASLGFLLIGIIIATVFILNIDISVGG